MRTSRDLRPGYWPRTAQDDEEFFMVGSQSVHLRLLYLQCTPRDTELYLGDFEQPGRTSDAKQVSPEDVREDKERYQHGAYYPDSNLLSAVHYRNGAADHVVDERCGGTFWRILLRTKANEFFHVRRDENKESQ